MTLLKRNYPTIANFSCLKRQVELLEYLQKEKPELFNKLVTASAEAHLKFDRDVVVTVYLYKADDKSTKEMSSLDDLKSTSSFIINTNVCSSYIDELDWHVENIFLICY